MRREREENEDVNVDEGGIQSVLDKIEAMDDGPILKNKVTPIRKAVTTDSSQGKRERVASKVASTTTSKAAKLQTSFKKDKTEAWKVQKAALAEKFGATGWQPRKRLSPDTLEGIRALNKSDPASYSTAMLAQHFKVSPDAVRRILKSQWRPSEDEVEDRRQRWEKRGIRKWEEMSKQGAKPPAKWRAMGVKSPEARGREREKSDRRGGGDEHVKWAG
jgi:hypothetical protein